MASNDELYRPLEHRPGYVGRRLRTGGMLWEPIMETEYESQIEDIRVTGGSGDGQIRPAAWIALEHPVPLEQEEPEQTHLGDFNVGQVVAHKASGERGVIIKMRSGKLWLSPGFRNIINGSEVGVLPMEVVIAPPRDPWAIHSSRSAVEVRHEDGR